MNLWIRTQDRETLLKVDNIYANETKIETQFNDWNHLVLGTYKTKERALEVLDKIQHNIKIERNFYQIPKE